MAQIGLKSLAGLCHRVGMALRAGVDVRRVWETESGRGSGQQRDQIGLVSRQVSAGGSVTEAIRDCGYFPSLTCEMVEVGEQTGKLDDVLLELAEHYEQIVNLRKSFLRGISWPLLSLVFSVVIIGLLILILGMIGTKEQDVLGLGLGPVGSFVAYLLVVVFVGSLIALPAIAIWRGWLGAKWMRKVMKIPVLGRTLEMMALARVAWSLSLAHGAGMEIRQALRLAITGSQNSLYLSHLDEIDRSIAAGNEVHQTLRDSEIFPNDFLDVVETGEMSGQMPETLAHLSKDYRQRANSAAKTLVTVASYVVWAIVAIVLIFLIFRMFTTLVLGPIDEASRPL